MIQGEPAATGETSFAGVKHDLRGWQGWRIFVR
jgi:hypothetical protein